MPDPITKGAGEIDASQAMTENALIQSDVDVYLKGPNGTPLQGAAIVTLTKLNGQVFDQKPAKAGYVRFNGVPPTAYTVQVVAPAFEGAEKQFELRESSLAKVTIDMQPMSNAEDAAESVAIFALSPKAQKEVGKALHALQGNKPNDALKHLETAQKTAPKSAEVEYLFGIYSSQLNDPVQAKAYWMKTLQLDPKHLSALLEVSDELLHENKPAEATPYLKRAVDAEPSSWRAHALLSEASVLQGQNDDAIKHAERAIELGHDRAATVQLVLARALAARGDRVEATKVLQAYVTAHPADTTASKDLETLKNSQLANASGDTAAATVEMTAVAKAATALLVPSNWLPPDVDESMPPVIAGTPCNVDDVVRKAGKQIVELVSNVDRFAATETLTNQSINKYGLASDSDQRKFDYVVSIQEVRRGMLNVEEYRSSRGSQGDFPDGVATNGLPALVLIFHPYYVPNFEFACEGLARWNGGIAWQVHFRQRPDKPNTIKKYRIGVDGPSYPAALKGRAWISADSYQILRLETDLVRPLPQIRLAAERTEVEYGPVQFRSSKVSMWLPQSADVYYDWQGRRVHRRHSFSNYMLFAVDDKQKISAPKVKEAPPADGPRDSSN
ncbi:MAG: tetratricopeptide repeat protein [Candidatus Acidiferrum sp.]